MPIFQLFNYLILNILFRFRRRNSSLENLNEMFLNDETSDKPKEDRIVKFKDEVLPERGRSRSNKKSQNSKEVKAIGASILKDSSKLKNSPEQQKQSNETKPVLKSAKKVKAPIIPSPAEVVKNVNKQLTKTDSAVVQQTEQLPEQIDSKPTLTVEISKQTVDLNKQTADLNKQTADLLSKQTADLLCKQTANVISSSEDCKDKEESGYDSDQTLATLSAKDSASEASSLNSPASSVKKDIKDSNDLSLTKDGKKLNFFGHKFCLVPKSKLLIKMYYQRHEFLT